MVYVHQSKLGDDGLEVDAMRKFGENVGELFFRTNGKKMQGIDLYLLSDNVAIKLNVLGSFVEARFVSYVPYRLFVPI